MRQPVLVWDLPTRAFHWLLAAPFFGALLIGRLTPALRRIDPRLH